MPCPIVKLRTPCAVVLTGSMPWDWGTCTVHEASARRPKRAETVRAHHWVVMGDLGPGKPWTYLPPAARLYGRQRQLPAGESCRTKPALAVAWLRQADGEAAAPILAVCEGA